jgi:subtilisin family serine protease
MKTLITCHTSQDCENIYSMLLDPNAGHNELRGQKKCTNLHSLIPTVVEFDLNQKEIEELKQLSEVKSVSILPKVKPKPILHLNPSLGSNQTVKPRPIGYSSQYAGLNGVIEPQIVPHSIMTSLTSEPMFKHNFPLRVSDSEGNIYDDSAEVAFADCSNVDIVVLDTGVDATHPDFKDLIANDGTSRVVDFNWSQLTDQDGMPILDQSTWEQRSPFFLRDAHGHGTCCASLAAGNRCGVAKNAKIYSLKIFSGAAHDDETINEYGVPSAISPLTALQLGLAFLIAKQQNLFGLDSSRPTIFTNSWGYGRYPIITEDILGLNTSDEQTMMGLASVGGVIRRKISDWTDITSGAVLPGFYAAEEDIYVREIVSNGGHFLHAAGNENAFVDPHWQNAVNYHIIIKDNVWSNPLAIPSTPETDAFFDNLQATTLEVEGYGWPILTKEGNVSESSVFFNWYADDWYLGKDTLGFYSSPGAGLGFNKTEYPVITVGDLTVPGLLNGVNDSAETVNDDNINWAIQAWREPLSMGADERTSITPNVRYRAYTDAQYVKSWYSNFGPGVDIYTTGNETFAAKSSFDGDEEDYWCVGDESLINLENGQPQDKYKYMNGTSAATPIAAGILATYLASNPTATASQGKEWLMNNAVRGNIQETQTVERSFVNLNGETVLINTTDIFNGNGGDVSAYGRLCDSRSNYLAHAQFHSTSNLVAQAYPLRGAILNETSAGALIAETELSYVEDAGTTPDTHWDYSTL